MIIARRAKTERNLSLRVPEPAYMTGVDYIDYIQGATTMWRRRASQSEPTLPSSNPAYAYPFSTSQGAAQTPPRRGPIEGPYGQRLTRRVTWRSSTYRIIAYLYVLGILYIVWLIRDLFYLPFSSSSSSTPAADGMPNVPSPKE